MGWRYEGHRGTERVTFISHAIVSGPSYDDYTTRWIAHETGESYVYWFMHHRDDPRDDPRGVQP